MQVFFKKGSILIEGLIIMTLINVMIVLIFNNIQNINKFKTDKIHQERAIMLMNTNFEKLISARNTFLNRNRKNGWTNFIKPIKEVLSNDNLKYLHLNRHFKDTNNDYIKGQFYLSSSDKGFFYEESIAPFSTYTTYIEPKKDPEENFNKINFSITIRWKENQTSQTGIDLNSIQQDFVLTNHYIYENLY